MHPRHLLAAPGIVAIWGFHFVVIKPGLKELPRRLPGLSAVILALVVWRCPVVPVSLFVLAHLVERPAHIVESISHSRWSSIAAIAYLAYPTTLLGLYPAASGAPLTLLVTVFWMTASVVVLGEELQPWKMTAFALVVLGLCVNLFGARMHVGLKGARQ